VFPFESVAVAVTKERAGTVIGSLVLKLVFPPAFVLRAVSAPRKVVPSSNPEASQLALLKNSRV